MRRAALCLAALAMAATAASARDRGERHGHHGPPGGGRGGYANPSALIAAEIALHQLAQEKGQWRAWRDNAAPGADLLTPGPTPAEAWLKDRPEPQALPGWDPQAVWMSCDGSFGAVEGSWTEPGSTGLYAAVWQRQEDGSYKWLLRQRIGRDQPVTRSDMISAIVADCPPREERHGEGPPPSRPSRDRMTDKDAPPAPPVDPLAGYSTDHSFYWRSGKDGQGVPRLLVAIRKNGAMETVLGSELGAPPGS